MQPFHHCAVQADMSIKESVDELAGVVGDKVDVLVNNAGTLTESSVLKGAPATQEPPTDQLRSSSMRTCLQRKL